MNYIYQQTIKKEIYKIKKIYNIKKYQIPLFTLKGLRWSTITSHANN